MIRILVIALVVAHAPAAVAGLHPQHAKPMMHRSLTGPPLMLTDGDGHYVTLLDQPHDD